MLQINDLKLTVVPLKQLACCWPGLWSSVFIILWWFVCY